MSSSLSALAGAWSGTKHLFMGPPPTPAISCAATLQARPAAGGGAMLLEYTWSYENEPQAGAMLVVRSTEGPEATVAWTDSFHQSRAVMLCPGSHEADGHVKVRGSYPAPSGPDWGWRIEIEPPRDATLTLRMFNVEPEGEECPAVTFELTRS